MRTFFIFLILASVPGIVCAQKYNFVNWTVEDGLLQSQASVICQDRYRQLWIGTEGGLCRFDGRKFSSYTVQDGLASNHVSALLFDNSDRLWIGTNNGISVFDGSGFRNLKVKTGGPSNTRGILQAQEGDIYVLDNLSVYAFSGNSSRAVFISGDTTEKVTSLFKGPSGEIFGCVYAKGIYKLSENKTWKVLLPAAALPLNPVNRIYITMKKDTFIVTYGSLYQLNRNAAPPAHLRIIMQGINVFSMAEDALGQLWLGSESGAFRLTGDSITHFDERRGLSDNAVNHIFPDAENNLWFATNADGIFKFRENTFTYYDKSSGLLNPIIMGVTETPDRLIYTGGYGGGLYMIRNSDPQLVLNRDGSPFTHKINCLYADDENNVWIGTLNHGIWKYSVKQGFTRLTASGAQDIRSATCFLKTRSGDLLIGGNQGLFVLRNEKISRVDMPARLITSMKQFSDSQVIAGTSRGIFLIDKSFKASPFAEKHFQDASVLCLALHGEHLWVGTSDKGVFNYDMNKKALLNYNTTDGLPSNFIYSIHAEGDVAWIGTGYGICNLKVDRNGTVKALKNYGRSDGLLGMECNHNSLLKGRDSSLWFGTTKGLFHFNPNSSRVGTERPVVLLRSVKLYSSPITDSAFFKNKENWFNVPQGLKLPARQNHLTFELSSIYFTNPDNILFRYKLQGVDKNFSVNSNPILIYPSIPPGTYTLIVKAFTKNGMESVNSVHYSFTIQKAFYQTRWFQFVVIMLLLLTGGVIAWAFTVGRQRRKQKEKEMLARIREEEFQKLRQRTAEDFHDEMGNSLTRISVLTDVLKTRVNGKETEVTRLVNQIKENTTALYNGSRDIIWSLNAQNDGVYEIAEHIKDIGLEMFHDTPVEFSYHHNIPAGSALKLKLDYSRNLTMIFKEAYSNIIRHSGADKVFVSLNLKNDSELLISITDNGKGFSTTNNKNGNGLRNMENRVRRMQGELQVTSEQKKGTEINMRFNSIFTN